MDSGLGKTLVCAACFFGEPQARDQEPMTVGFALAKSSATSGPVPIGKELGSVSANPTLCHTEPRGDMKFGRSSRDKD